MKPTDVMIRTIYFIIVLHDQEWVVVNIAKELNVRSNYELAHLRSEIGVHNLLHAPIVAIVLQ